MNGEKEKKMARKEFLKNRTMIAKVTTILGESIITKIEGLLEKSLAGV